MGDRPGMGDPRDILHRVAPSPQATLRYGDHPDQLADLWLPRPSSAGSPVALILFFHGGFWRDEYDRSHTAPLAYDLSGRGYAVALVEYRRTGARSNYPATFEDIAAAVRLLPALVSAYTGVDRLILAGHSAGGHLALWGAHRVGADAVLALAPVADLRAAYALDLDGGAVAALLGGGPDAFADRYAETDPLSLLPIGAPMALLHGDLDQHVPVEFSRRFVAAARACGDSATLTELPGVEHFALIDPASTAWPIVTQTLSEVATRTH
jgi:acetyl esterase/lipase